MKPVNEFYIFFLPFAAIAGIGCAKDGTAAPVETPANGEHKAGCNGHVEGAPAAKASGPQCKAQDATFKYSMPQMRCLAKPIYRWDGAKCDAIPVSTADGWGHCSGADCGSLFDSEAACKDAFKSCGG